MTAFPLADRKVLVTGAASGIGRAIALELAAQGAHVAAADIQPPEQTLASIRDAGGHGVAIAADVSRPDQVKAMVAACVRDLGGVDGLVNNAGIFLSAGASFITGQTLVVDGRLAFQLMPRADLGVCLGTASRPLGAY